MKINITTNHIRIYRILKFFPSKDINFICQFLNMSKQNVILYIKQIFSFIYETNSKSSLKEIIDEICENEMILYTLKQEQIFTKEDRIFYITLKLLRDGEINLNAFSLILDVSRRTLNDDLISVKKNLKIYNLEISSIPSKGISLIGKIEDIKICSVSFLFKFLIEFDELPPLMTKDYLNFFKKIDYAALNKEVEYFCSIFGFDTFINNNKLVIAIFLSYSNGTSRNTLKNMSFDKFKQEFNDGFKDEFITKLYAYLKTSILGDFPTKYIKTLVITLKFCNGSLKNKNISMKKEVNIIKSLFSKTLSFNLNDSPFLEKFIHRFSIASYESSFIQIFDLSFLSLNLDKNIFFNCYELFIQVQKVYSNIQFSNLIFLYLWSLNNEVSLRTADTIVVYKNIPKFLQQIIKTNFLIKEKINISYFIKYHELNKHLIEDEISSFITFENIESEENYPFIKKYPLPL